MNFPATRVRLTCPLCLPALFTHLGWGWGRIKQNWFPKLFKVLYSSCPRPWQLLFLTKDNIYAIIINIG